MEKVKAGGGSSLAIGEGRSLGRGPQNPSTENPSLNIPRYLQVRKLATMGHCANCNRWTRIVFSWDFLKPVPFVWRRCRKCWTLLERLSVVAANPEARCPYTYFPKKGESRVGLAKASVKRNGHAIGENREGAPAREVTPAV